MRCWRAARAARHNHAVLTSAIFVDFDNVFGGLHALDPVAARQIAQNPDRWMHRLAGDDLVAGPTRRWLVRRCYMNPVGWVWENGERLYLSRFRPFFVRAGFEVVDCPPLTRSSKNAADIRLCLDVMDLLGSRRQPDEVVIASSDSDFTPLLHRVRSEGCRTALITTGDAVSAYKALADEILDAPTFLELLAEEPDEEVEVADPAPPEGPDAPAEVLPDGQASGARERFAAFVRAQYEAATEPLNLAQLSVLARRSLGPEVAATGWFGAGSFGAALRQVGLPGARLGQHHVWDERRHAAPPDSEHQSGLPDTIAQVAAVTDLPALDRELWPHVYTALGEYAATHDFNLTESTKWTRDHLAAQGHPVGRSIVNYVMQGATLGGASLRMDPTPDAGQIAAGFYGAVRHRAKSAGLALDPAQAEELRRWLGAPEPAAEDGTGSPAGDGAQT